jgi:hypothetical protein
MKRTVESQPSRRERKETSISNVEPTSRVKGGRGQNRGRGAAAPQQRTRKERGRS